MGEAQRRGKGESESQIEKPPGPARAPGREDEAGRRLCPDVDWTNLFRKVGDLTKRPFDWSADVAKLQARTLLVFADADAIRPEHIVEFWKALGGGQRDAGIDGSAQS